MALDPVVTMLGAQGTFGTLSSMTVTPSGHSFSVMPVNGWGFGAGESAFYTRAAPDGQIIISTVPFTNNELNPTSDHAEIGVYNPVKQYFYRQVIPTSQGALTAVSPGASTGGTDAGGGDVTVVNNSGTQAVLTTQTGYYFNWDIPSVGLYPVFAQYKLSAGQWTYSQADSLTGDQWEATNPSLFGSVIDPGGQTTGTGANFWSPRHADQIAILPASGNVVVGHYFGFGGTAVASGAISVISPSGSLAAAYQIPNITALSGTLTTAAVRDVQADPTGVINNEQFAVIYDAFGTGVHPTIQIFTYNQGSQTISPVSVPCVPGDTAIVPQYSLFGSDGTLYVSCGQQSNGLNSANMQVYLKKAGGWNLTSQAPVFGGWPSSSWPTSVTADYSLGFMIAQAIGGLAGPMATDPVTGALLVPGISSRLGVAIPSPGGITSLGPNLLSAFASGFAPSNVLSADDSTFATSLGTWTSFVGTIARVASPPVAPPVGTAAGKITQPFNSGNNAAHTGSQVYAVTPSTPYQADVWFLANSTARTCEAWIRWQDSGGVTIVDSTRTTLTDNTSTWSRAKVTATSPSNAAFAEVWMQTDSPALNEFHFWASNDLYSLSAAAAGWTSFLTTIQLTQLANNLWALQMTAPFNNEVLSATSPQVAVVPNTEYLAGAFFEAISGTPGQVCKVNVHWQDAGSNEISVTTCTMQVTDSTSSFMQATCGALAPANAATATVELKPTTTTTGQGHYAQTVTLQAQPFTVIPYVDFQLAALHNVVSPSSLGLLGRPSISGRMLYIPIPVQFSAAESAAYSASTYVPTVKPQFVAVIDLSQLLAPVILSTWTASRGIGAGTGTPFPPSMPLVCAIANTGSAGNGLIAFLSWTVPAGYLGADMAVTDDAHNTWFPVGAPSTSTPANGFTRCAIWASPSAQAAKNVYMSPCGLPNPVYPVVMGITVIEISNMSPYMGTPAVVTAVANAATTISANVATPAASAIMVGVGAIDSTSDTLTRPGGTWTSVTGVSQSGAGGTYQLKTGPVFQVASTSQTATWTSSASADMSAVTAAILVTNTAPSQPNANWPAFSFQAGFGSGALTPPGQITWTDITPRWLAGEETDIAAGKPYELDELQAAEITVTFDDNDGALTPGNTASPFFPGVTADVPMRLLGWWQARTYGVTYGFTERWPVTWDEEWYGVTQATLTDVWALQQNQLNSVLREEITWDPNLTHYWTCSDLPGSGSAQNIAPGNAAAVLQVVTSKNGALNGVQSFGNDGGSLPGDSSSTFWRQSGLTSGSEGYGYALYCADQGYPLLSGGITVMGWFNANPTGTGATQVQNSAQQLVVFRGANAGSTVAAFEVQLESPVGANPGAIRVSVWDVSTLVKTTTNVDTGDWLTAGFFHIALELTQTTWNLFLNGTSAATGSANLPSSISWLEFMGSADRQYTGSMLNGECGHLAVFKVQLTADRIRSIYLAGTPNPQTLAGGVISPVPAAQFGGDFPATRIERLLAWGGWTGPRSISQTSVTAMTAISDIQGTTAVVAASGKLSVAIGGQQAAQAVNNIVFSDGGFMFTDGNGTLCYFSRADLYNAAVAWTLGENVPGGEIPYLPDASLGYDKSLLYNGANLMPSDSVTGAPVVATNTSSIASHGEYVFNGTAYQQDINQVADEANWIVNTRGVITLRAESITVDAGPNTSVWPFFLGVQPAQPATVIRRPQESSYTATVNPIISQLTKTLDFEGGVAKVKVGTDMFPEGTVLTIGDSVKGQADGTHPLAW